MTENAYEPRYLAGILFFNRQDYFEAHEVWESLWMDTAGEDKRFFQALIQAAVALYHFGNGNLRGAAKLYTSSRNYMEKYGSPHLGIDTGRFWQDMERCFASLLEEMRNNPNPDRHTLRLEEALVPRIALDPEPEAWPEPEQFVSDEDD